MPRVNGDVRRLGRVGIAAADLGRRQKPFHALNVASRCAGTHVHVTATNPLCAGRHSDLITHAIVTDRRARSVRAVKEIVARER